MNICEDISQKNGYSVNATVKEYRLESLLMSFQKYINSNLPNTVVTCPSKFVPAYWKQYRSENVLLTL